MISELGKLKDSGLRLIAVKEALQHAGPVSDDEALKKAKEFFGPGQLTLEQLLINADQIVKEYFKENQLQQLIIGIANTNSKGI